jgi:hypothetical protein
VAQGLEEVGMGVEVEVGRVTEEVMAAAAEEAVAHSASPRTPVSQLLVWSCNPPHFRVAPVRWRPTGSCRLQKSYSP